MTELDYDALRALPMSQIRSHIRAGGYRGQTAGFAPGNLQANLVVLGDGFADDFHAFCLENARPCPLVGVSGRGDPIMRDLGDIDIRTDIPSYNIYRDGILETAVPDIAALWTDDMVAFALGCSFSFERALADAGIRMKHIEANRTVAMYATNIELTSVGRFAGEMVVSMRPIPKKQVDLAIEVTTAYPHAHGAPIHVGNGEAIGISDIDSPDWGEAAQFEADEVPVFWACGVTPQNVLSRAAPPLCITHTPGRMLVTDLTEDEAKLRDAPGLDWRQAG
ncbi:MAG: putative hydro-lyase [Pseudomonadota bacterium]